METYTIHKGTMRRIPEWPELRWWAERIIAFVIGLMLGSWWRLS